jgi:tetratricopeptide (TPR) repeat protein
MKKRILLVLACACACAGALLLTGCSPEPKEYPKAVTAEAASLIGEAQFAMQIREFARAEELIQRALKLRDDMPEYWVSLGMARVRQDNASGARKAYEQGIKLHVARYKKDKQPSDLMQQAFVTALLGKTDEALKLLEKGLKAHPDDEIVKKMASPRGLPRTFQTPEFKELTVK